MLVRRTAMVDRRIRCYSELEELYTFKDRFGYLKLNGAVADETFGFDRYLNQKFYHSIEWRRVRDYVIARDCGCDLGIADFPIRGKVYIHHMNPMTKGDLQKIREELLDPEYLICVSHNTHNAIHYGDESLLIDDWHERTPDDTSPWKHTKEAEPHGQYTSKYQAAARGES